MSVIQSGKELEIELSTAVAASDDVPFTDTAMGYLREDAADMKRLGKKQQFKRNFNAFSTLGFVSGLMATWEMTILVLTFGVSSGGFAGLFWMFTATCLVFVPTVASLAEMASMAPTSGGQYHWVSEFAPESCQKVLSYATGWMTVLAWWASETSGAFFSVTLIEVMINVWNPEYAFERWQYTLLMLAFIASTVVINTIAAPVLPLLESIALVFHCLGFLVVIISLWVLSPKATAREVFLEFRNDTGWSLGMALLLNQVRTLYCILGSDTGVHISEEVKDASMVVPRTIFLSYFLNLGLAFVMVITILFNWGSVDEAMAADIPYLVLVKNTGCDGVALMILIILFILSYVAVMTISATGSRETWAFARDRGLPFSDWIIKMNRRTQIPFNAVYLSSAIAACLCLINLGSTLAFTIIISVSVLALLSSYTISIGCILWRRLAGAPLPPARWSLGRWGVPVNALGFSYSVFAIVWCCFPTALPVKGSSANYAPALWVGVMVLAAVVYAVHGRKHYVPPVVHVEGRKTVRVGI